MQYTSIDGLYLEELPFGNRCLEINTFMPRAVAFDWLDRLCSMELFIPDFFS
jgi:hypothetical protein